ncbi:phage tail tape measure protein [Pedobacter sp. NJ-S-72]
MGAGQAKITLLLELKNRLKSALGQASSTLANSVGAMKSKMKELKGSITDVFESFTSKIPGLDEALSALTSPLAALVAGIALLGTVYIKSVKLADEWNTSLRKVNVTAQLGKEELQGVSQQLLDIGKRNTGDLMEVPETFNKIVSAGFDVKTSLAALEPTLLAAKAGFTSAGVAAEAATNIMGSTGITDAIKIYDVLFATLSTRARPNLKISPTICRKLFLVQDRSGFL